MHWSFVRLPHDWQSPSVVDPSMRAASALRVAQRLPQASVTFVSSPSQTEHRRSGKDDGDGMLASLSAEME